MCLCGGSCDGLCGIVTGEQKPPAGIPFKRGRKPLGQHAQKAWPTGEHTIGRASLCGRGRKLAGNDRSGEETIVCVPDF
eukprot:2467995-Prymnesium_polylepis.1